MQKRFLSILLIAVMVLSICTLASCDNLNDETLGDGNLNSSEPIDGGILTLSTDKLANTSIKYTSNPKINSENPYELISSFIKDGCY